MNRRTDVSVSARTGDAVSARTVRARHGAVMDEDAAVVVAVITALAAGRAEETPAVRSVWADPAGRLGRAQPGPHTWWASGGPR